MVKERSEQHNNQTMLSIVLPLTKGTYISKVHKNNEIFEKKRNACFLKASFYFDKAMDMRFADLEIYFIVHWLQCSVI